MAGRGASPIRQACADRGPTLPGVPGGEPRPRRENADARGRRVDRRVPAVAGTRRTGRPSRPPTPRTWWPRRPGPASSCPTRSRLRARTARSARPRRRPRRARPRQARRGAARSAEQRRVLARVEARTGWARAEQALAQSFVSSTVTGANEGTPYVTAAVVTGERHLGRASELDFGPMRRRRARHSSAQTRLRYLPLSAARTRTFQKPPTATDRPRRLLARR